MERKNINIVLLLMLIMTAISCGKNASKDERQSEQQFKEEAEGQYRAVLDPINKALLKNRTNGTAVISILGDEIRIRVNLIQSTPLIKQMQNIHYKSQCPNEENDENSDGVIDIEEGINTFGPILIPLDNDLNSQETGFLEFPKSNTSGSYSWNELASLENVLKDLTSPSEENSLHMIKLNKKEGLNLSERVLVIYGIKGQLPESVGTILNLNNAETVPVACGRIVRIKNE